MEAFSRQPNGSGWDRRLQQRSHYRRSCSLLLHRICFWDSRHQERGWFLSEMNPQLYRLQETISYWPDCIICTADEQLAKRADQDSENASQAQVPSSTNSVADKATTKPAKDKATTKPAKESGSGAATRPPGASAEPSSRSAAKNVVAKSLQETMSESVIPLLTSALRKGGITDLDVTFEDNQVW